MLTRMPDDELTVKETTGNNFDQRIQAIRQRNAIDSKFGYHSYTDHLPKNAWLVNIKQGELLDETTKTIVAVLDLYFIEEDGCRFKIPYIFRPYLYLETTAGKEFAVADYISICFHFSQVELVEKENLELKNHLSGLKSKFLRVSFPSTSEMGQFKHKLMPTIRKNRQKLEKSSEYTTMLSQYMGVAKINNNFTDEGYETHIIDIREYDLPYDMRVCIDQHFFVGHWYTVVGLDPSTQKPFIQKNSEMLDSADPIICAFDIETTKAPLKFPDPSEDQIMMISYMIDAKGFLIINRQCVSADIENFEYTPKPEFRGEFQIFNELDERATLLRFFNHLLRVKPSIIVTYNGDFFDWPFVDARAAHHSIDLSTYLGFFKDSQDEYKHSNCIHMDAFKWVQRDSYLPMGSQSLKAATREKLRYDPVELDPEEMVSMAVEQPNVLASYSVSDAVATYYLYYKYVHPFIFALCTIIPLSPDDVLRKGSGTLCEALLMVQAFQNNIIFPNKQIAKDNCMTTDGHLIESETYVGGHVEALESGVFRSDIPCQFNLDTETLQQLKEEVRPTMEHSLYHDANVSLDDIVDFDPVCKQIESILDTLMDQHIRMELPRLYHLDVGAMYPNIILTNRLQPPAVVTEAQCMACIYNAPDARCKRSMDWEWRAEIFPATRGEYDRLMQQLEQEKFGKPPRPFNVLPKDERIKIAKKRIHEYCKTAYKKLHVTRQESRTTTICQREHSFYVDTVRAFRDRRYEYKEMNKKAKAALGAVPSDDVAGRKMAQSRVVLYDSLQLAHKCILNSFYGYVMRKGSRWFSMEMAGIVCYTGANIITEARQLIERIGRPLELDTDGIWCLLPASFPDNFIFHRTNGKEVKISYPGAMLNALVKDRFTNDQYHTIHPVTAECHIHSENSIFFEVDGPYYAIVLPASKEEGKKLKKRYAVFNFDKSLAELKGFEVKRRGELAIIKYFQTEVFKSFLKGITLQEIYENVAKEANYWLSILYDKGQTLSSRELFELIGESKNMSRMLEDYGGQKSTSITTAKRLAEFLGEEMVRNKGLACKFIVSRYPLDEPVTERTIPQAIFEAEPKVRVHYLRKWTKGQGGSGLDFSSDTCLRELIDWQYYIDRLNSCIQKIVTIPAALQGLPNPLPNVPHPQWLENKRRERIEMHAQPRITEMFKVLNGRTPNSRVRVGFSQWSLKSNKSKNTPHEGITKSRKRIADEQDEPSHNQENNNQSYKLLAKRVCTEIQMVDLTDQEAIDENSAVITNPIINEHLHLIPLNELERAEDATTPVAATNIDKDSLTTIKNTNNDQQIKKGPKKTKAQLQRDSRRVAIAQHANRRIDREHYDSNKLTKKTWRNHGFTQWLDFLKAKWRMQMEAKLAISTAIARAEMHSNLIMPEDGTDALNATTNAVDGSISLSKRREATWQILQILETKMPGQFTVFALVDGLILRRINLIVPRTIYVDDTEPRQIKMGRLTQKLLPKMRPSAYLYEFVLDEALFISRMTDLNTELCSMRINGIYETRIPPLFKAITHTGVLCHVGIKNSNEFSLEKITRYERPMDRSVTNYSVASALDYSRLHLFFFYEYMYRSRSVFALFIPRMGNAYFFVVNREPIDLINLDNLYLNELNKFVDTEQQKRNKTFPDLDECKRIKNIVSIQSVSVADASRRLQTVLNSLKLAPSDPAILCLQTNRESAKLFKDFQSLCAFPFLCLPMNDPPNLMNVLDWANALAKRSIQHFFNCFEHFKEYWEISTQIEIPVCNLHGDVPSLALDALFARELQAKNYLLWASPSSVPDFGGKELEDLRLSNDWQNSTFTKRYEYLINKETFEAGCITAELSLGAVAVTALLQSARISEAEGTTEYAGFSSQMTTLSIEDALSHRFGLTKYDDAVAVSGELRALKEVFYRLIKDIHYNQSVIADQLVVNMNRWVCDPNSLMFNPAIRNALSILMRKLCLLLVAEIQQLGAKVIHCSFTRLVLSTNRHSLSLAKLFLKSLLIALSQKQMFASLQIDVQRYSRVLLWMDSANYSFANARDEAIKDGRIDSHFSIAGRLPEEYGLQKSFNVIVIGFMGMLSKKRKENTDKFDEEEFSKYAIDVLTNDVMESLFRATDTLVSKRARLQKLANENDCVDIPLEFVNCICRVLSVNSALEEHIDRIRNQLMLILRRDDSICKSALTDWTPPNAVLLESVFCSQCSQCADLDICQRLPLTDDNSEQRNSRNEGMAILNFLCPHCGAEYQSHLIEEMLIERIGKLHMAFILQDWQCVSCKKIGANFLSKHCECNNPFEGTIAIEELQRNLKLVKRVAETHRLENLEYVIEHVLQCYQY